jgi:hypothetical protein
VALARLGASQHGVVSRAQLVRLASKAAASNAEWPEVGATACTEACSRSGFPIRRGTAAFWRR